MIKRLRIAFDYAARHRLDTVFWVAAAIGGGMIGFGISYGWIVAIGFGAAAACIVMFGDASVDSVVDMNKRTAAELVEQVSLQRREEEPLPPWIEEPGAGPFHVIWRMGAEDYLGDFYNYFRTLDQNRQEEYFLRYDLGTDWPDRKHWYEALFNDYSDEI